MFVFSKLSAPSSTITRSRRPRGPPGGLHPRAGRTLGGAQPAVSTQIARLEETVGFALFERSSGRLKPTAEGLLFYAEATRVLGQVDRLQAATVQIREGNAGR